MVKRLHRLALSACVALVVVFFAFGAAAEPVRILVAVGHKIGLAAERPLKFADQDAAHVKDVMVAYGSVRPEHAFVLAQPSRAQLWAAIDRAKGEAQKHRADEVTLVFYFSGHGDREAIHLDERVALSDLSQKLADVPAALRIVVTDACRATREKGFTADEPFAINAATIPQATGQVWLHASSDGEAAQESDELQGAIFTHAWLNGLRGAADANGDSRVTLDESFAFAHSQTLIRSAKSSGVMQKPEAVVSLREGAPVVLTQTAARMATLSLPQARDTHFLVYAAGAKSVLSEVWGMSDRRLALRVPPGRYVVQRRAGATGAAAQIALAAGEQRDLADGDFQPASLEMLAKKGGDVEPDRAELAPVPRPRHHEISAGWDLGANARTGLVHGPRASYAYAFNRWLALSVGGGLELASRATAEKDERLTSLFGRSAVEVRWPIGALTLRGGAGGRAGWAFQTLVPTNGVSGPAAAETHNGAFVFGPEAVLGARLGFGFAGAPRAFFDLSGTGSLSFVREEQSLRGVAGLTGAAALGGAF